MNERVGMMNNRLPNKYGKMSVSDQRFVGIDDGYESDRMSRISASSRPARKYFRDRSMNEQKQWVNGGDPVYDGTLSELRQARVTQGFDKLSLYNENDNYMEERVNVNGRNRSELEEYLRAQRMVAHSMSYANSVISEDDGYSNRSRHGYGYKSRNMNDVDRYSNIGSVVSDDVSECLNRFDGIRDQERLYDYMIPKDKEKAYINSRRMAKNSYSGSVNSDRYSEMNGSSMNPSYLDSQFSRRTYFNEYIEPPQPRRDEFGGSGFKYGNPLTLRRDPFHTPAMYPKSQSRSSRSETYMEDDMTYRPRGHHPSCTCSRCSIPRPFPPIPRSPFNDNHKKCPSSFGTLPLSSNDHPLHSSWPSDIDSEVDCLPLPCVGLHCLPLAGGSPFLSCFNCFEVLLLPKTVSSKIKCGACSAEAVIAFSDQRLVFRADLEAIDNNPSLQQQELRIKSPTNRGRETESQSVDIEQDQKPSHHYSLSTQTFDLEVDTESELEEEMNLKIEDEETIKLKDAPPPAGSSLQEHFEYSNTFHIVNRRGEENTLAHSKQKTPQIPMDYISSETDKSSNTETSFDSQNASRKTENIFAGSLKKSSKDSNKSSNQEEANVTVNGHLIPHQIVKKAEKVAGIIYPGNYWYDYKAGFWGEMGSPCLGIIPPFIEEFKFPLPDKCSGGNTTVFVNGRELNQKDMDLLRRRGLPAERNRSYTVELSGRIIDNDTGMDLKRLGKLAPTVERLQHGFGMRVPKTAS